MTTPTTPTLPSEQAVRVLLSGFTALTKPISRLPKATQKEIAALWHGGAPAIAAAWREHEPWLRAEAQRLGIRTKESQYWAEKISDRLKEKGQ